MKSQVTDWEKIFSKDISNKGILLKIHEELLKLNSKKSTQFKKMGKRPDKTSWLKKITGGK